MNFSIGLMLQKALAQVIKTVVSLAIGFIGMEKLNSLGIQVDVAALTAGLTIVAAGLLEALRNYLKQKFKISWL